MFLHLTYDTFGHEPSVGMDFRDPNFGIDTRIGLVEPSCDEDDCPNSHPDTIVLSVRHVSREEMDVPADMRDEYVPTARLILKQEDAALAVAIWVRFLSEECPELLAEAMDRAAEIETVVRGD